MSSRHTQTLANGLTLVVHQDERLPAFAISAVIGCGSRHESAQHWGLTHFVEHMLFRGGEGFADSSALLAPVEAGGGSLNAETWRDHTHVCALVHPAHWQGTLQAVAAMLRAPLFAHIDTERALVEAEILQEIDEQGDETSLHELSRKAIWGRHPMARRITGSLANVQGFSRAQLQQLHQAHYHGDNIVIAIASPHSAADILAQAAPALQGIGKKRRAPRSKQPRFAPRKPLHLQPCGGSQTMLQLSYAALPENHPDYAAQHLLSAMLSDGMASRLHRALSEDSGLVYSFDAGLDCYHDCGVFDLDMQVAPHRAAQAVQAAQDVFATLAAQGPSQAELRHAQQRAELTQHMGQLDAAEIAYDMAVETLFARPNPAQFLQQIQAVSCADVQRVARAIFVDAPRHLMGMGALNKSLRNQLQALWADAPQPAAAFAPAAAAPQKRARMPRPGDACQPALRPRSA